MISDRPWSDFSESDYTPEQFCRAALIDLNPAGAEKVKANCKLPVLEPSGALNRNACHAAASVLAGGRGGVNAPAEAKRAAARRLIARYRELAEEAPPALRRMAM